METYKKVSKFVKAQHVLQNKKGPFTLKIPRDFISVQFEVFYKNHVTLLSVFLYPGLAF